MWYGEILVTILFKQRKGKHFQNVVTREVISNWDNDDLSILLLDWYVMYPKHAKWKWTNDILTWEMKNQFLRLKYVNYVIMIYKWEILYTWNVPSIAVDEINGKEKQLKPIGGGIRD